MARNWTLTEAVNVIKDGSDKAARQEIAKRYPLLATATIDEIINAIPEKVSARMIETRLAEDIDDDAESAADEKPAKQSVKKTSGDMEPKPWSEMSQYEKKKARKAGAEFVAECKALDEDDDDEDEKPVKKSAAKPVKKKAAQKSDDVDDDDDEDFEDFDDDDDFDDDEEDEKPAKKPAKKSSKGDTKAKSKKAAKKPADDNDDDFDDDDDDDLDDF